MIQITDNAGRTTIITDAPKWTYAERKAIAFMYLSDGYRVTWS